MLMGSRLRKLALAVHLALSVSWIGAVAAYVVLDVTAATSHDPLMVRATWISMGLIVWWAIVPLALASLLTGLIMSLGTKWGLIRYWWVLISFLLTALATLVLLVKAVEIGGIGAVAANPATSSDALRGFGNTLPHSVGGLMLLLVVMALNIYKPPGLTSYGRRKQREARTSPQPEAHPAATARL